MQEVVFTLVMIFLLLPFLAGAWAFLRRPWAGLVVAASYLSGGMIVWWRRPPQWTMPFWQTVHASMDAEHYGHPLEHQAEQVLVSFVFGALLGGIAGCAGVVAYSRWRLWAERRSAHSG